MVDVYGEHSRAPLNLPGPTTSDRWLGGASRGTAARARVYCFPHAGAGPSLFRTWQQDFPGDVEVVPVHLPGRERRFTEPPHFSVSDVVDAIAGEADRPFSFYGHSMGGLLAYEVTAQLHARDEPLPVSLHVGGCRAPHVRENGPLDGLSTLPDRELVARLGAAGGTSPEVLAEPDLVELLLPALRADFAWLDAYVHEDRPPIPVPIVSWLGDEDGAVPPEHSTGWERHTTAGCVVRTLSGGHFFLHEHTAVLAAALSSDLACGDPLGDELPARASTT